MRRNTISTIGRGLWALLPLAFLLFGCDAESPTAPTQTPVPPVTNNPPAQSTWNITITADPDEFSTADEGLVSNITVTARRSDNGQAVPNGTTALLNTTQGTLTTASGSGQSVAIIFDNTGTAYATLNATTATATTIILRAQIEQSFGSTNIQVFNEEVEPLQIRSISPISGPPSGGTVVTILGQGFQSPVRLSFVLPNGQTLLLTDVQLSGSTRITARTPAVDLPAGENFLATLRLENGFDETGEPGGTDSISAAFTYTRNGGGSGNPTTMKIFSLSPTSGPNEGGTRVTILGEGFGSQVQVYFTNGPLIEAQIVSLTSTRLEVITPSATGPNGDNANVLVALRLVDAQTGATVTQAGAFQYGAGPSTNMFVSSISPNRDEYLGGTLVTLFGQGFDEPVTVSLGGVAQQVISVTGTEIVVRTVRVSINCADTSGPTTVVNIENNVGNQPGAPTFTYLPIRPRIISISPSSGPQSGGTQITIQGAPRALGQGFREPLRVLVDNVLANVIPALTTPTQIVATVPTFTGTFGTAPCTIAGTPPVTGTQNVPFAVPVEVFNLDNNCSDRLEAAFTYIPADQTCHPPDATTP